MKTILLAVTAAAFLAGCGLSPKQLEALGPGDKAICFHARAIGWSTTTSAASANDGNVPTINEHCEISAKP